MKIIKYVLKIFLVILLIIPIYLRINYGGGKEYPDISTTPIYSEEQLELVYAHSEPIGNVAVSKDTATETRVFFTIHPESRPETMKLMEVKHGYALPYPSEDEQDLFGTVLGVFTDQQQRLWTIDHGNHGFTEVKLLAFDLTTDTKVHEFVFPNSVAKKLSFFNDLSVSPDGNYIVVANVSFFGKKPSIAVYNVKTGESRNVLEGHQSVHHEGYVPVTPTKKMRFFGGLVDLLTGIDGIDFSRDGKYVYYAPMGHSELFRIPSETLLDFNKSEEEIESSVERMVQKPLSDGIRTDHVGNVYITDIEHQGIYIITPDGEGKTLIKDARIRWADGLSLSGENTFYLADSDIPNQMMQSKQHIKEHAPYHIFKFKAYSD